jgi:polyhydroxyalkanoate synthesis regulator phasin
VPPTPQKDFISRLADAGEDAINRLAEMPGANRLADTMNGMRARMDDLQKKVRGIDALERRVEELEKQVAALSQAATKQRAARSTTAKKTPPVEP